MNCLTLLFQQNIKDYFNKQSSFNELMWSTAVAIFAVGGMFGSVFGQLIASSLGRQVATVSKLVCRTYGDLSLFGLSALHEVPGCQYLPLQPHIFIVPVFTCHGVLIEVVIFLVQTEQYEENQTDMKDIEQVRETFVC